MSNWIISLLFAISIGTWLYAKTMRSSGNNTKNSIILASSIGIGIFFLSMILLGLAASALQGN